MMYNLASPNFSIVLVMTSLDVIGQIFENFFVFWPGVSSPITVQSFIGLALMVPA